jgi:hypothetical protein
LFIEPQSIDPYDPSVIADILIKDFVVILHKLFSITVRSLGILHVSHAIAEKFFRSYFESNTDQITFVTTYVDFLSKSKSFQGHGFAPGIIYRGTSKFGGLNCLGKAAVLGALMDRCGLTIRLGLLPDHAVIFWNHNDVVFYCDPTNNEVKPLHGHFRDHSNYSWYTAHPDDEFDARFLVVQDFRAGITNAVLESFQAKQLIIEELREDETYKFKPKVEFERDIIVIDWEKLRRTFFPGIEDYKTEYEREYLIECEHLREVRGTNDVKIAYITVIQNAVEAATGEKAVSADQISAFHNKHLPLLIPHADQIMCYLKHGIIPAIDIPESLWIYLKSMRNQFVESKKDPDQKDYDQVYLTLFLQRLVKSEPICLIID